MNRWIRLLVASVIISPLGLLASCETMTYMTHSQQGTTTTIILTRHGDRNMFAEDLNDKGRERAEALVKALGNMDVSAIYSPDVQRNLDTAKPLELHLGISSTVVSRGPNIDRDVTNAILSQHSGGVVLWVGNQDNLKTIYSRLGGQGEAPIAYGDLCIMKIKDRGPPEVIKKRYGPS